MWAGGPHKNTFRNQLGGRGKGRGFSDKRAWSRSGGSRSSPSTDAHCRDRVVLSIGRRGHQSLIHSSLHRRPHICPTVMTILRAYLIYEKRAKAHPSQKPRVSGRLAPCFPHCKQQSPTLTYFTPCFLNGVKNTTLVVNTRTVGLGLFSLLRTAVSFWRQLSLGLTGLSPSQNCSSERFSSGGFRTHL